VLRDRAQLVRGRVDDVAGGGEVKTPPNLQARLWQAASLKSTSRPFPKQTIFRIGPGLYFVNPPEPQSKLAGCGRCRL
jgi:hypothetical protein